MASDKRPAKRQRTSVKRTSITGKKESCRDSGGGVEVGAGPYTRAKKRHATGRTTGCRSTSARDSSSSISSESDKKTSETPGTAHSRSRRRLRSPDAAIEALAYAIVVQRKNVVFVTGAGLSVASGVQPFRTGPSVRAAATTTTATKVLGKKSVYEHDAYNPAVHQRKTRNNPTRRFPPDRATGLQEGLWDQVLWTTATRQAFRSDPSRWYETFWYPHFAAVTAGLMTPNSGHLALDQIIAKYRSNCRQITQNIDALQKDSTQCRLDLSESNVPPNESIASTKVSSPRLIEIHGRVGLYKCIPDSDSDTDSDSDDESDRFVHLGHRRKARLLRENSNACPYQYTKSLSQQDVVFVGTTIVKGSTKHRLGDVPNAAQSSTEKDHTDKRPPRCPHCNNVVMPQALMFDEGYHSHSFYQFELAEKWLSDCEVLVFVGTSFAVRLTQVALDHARDMDIPVYNFNTQDRLASTIRLNVSNIIGPAHLTLPKLLEVCCLLQTRLELSGKW